MKIYLRKIDDQCVNKQISYPKDILNEFLDRKGEKDTIICEGINSHHTEKVGLLLSTDPRFDNGIKRVLSSEGQFEAGDIMIMYKLKSKYKVELVKATSKKYDSLVALFEENDRHLLANLSDDVFNNQSNLDYVKFKKLIEWFVNQININNDIMEGTKTSGQGYKGGAIRELYKEWRDYGDFTLDCNLISGFQSAFSKVNYINKTRTGINIRPKFDKDTKSIEFLYIDVYDNSKTFSDEILQILEKEYLISELGLFDENDPNDLIKALFDDYFYVIKTLSKKEEVVFGIDNYTIDPLEGGENVILYGVPGAGKSYTIKDEYCNDDNYMERLVFHPDYTYSDFIGQILPKVGEDDRIIYEFTPGPFTKLLRKAILDPENMYYLIIEEVNRGNAPSIFGDIFQLLDRESSGKSEYKITNGDVAKIVYGNENHKVFVPSNMSILCTMNTSDQNVFTLDTAFQRRWHMRLIKNKFNDEPSEIAFSETKILDSDVTWKHFFTEINKIILSKNIRMTSSEDKRLGTHFISDEDLKYVENDNKQNSRFSEKVLKYLWDDAFKFTKEDIFDLGKVNSLEDVIEIFAESRKNDRFKVFKENIYNTLVLSKNTPSEKA